MAVQIFRLEDPKPMEDAEIAELLLRAIQANRYSQVEAVFLQFAQMVGNPLVGFYVAIEEGKPVGCALMLLPDGPLMECPQIVLIYNRGSDEAREALVKAVVDFGKAAGYNKGWGINRTGASDEAMCRLFGYVGFTHNVATIIEYEV